MIWSPLGCIWGLGLILGLGAVRGRLSKLVSSSEQGKLQNAFICKYIITKLIKKNKFNSWIGYFLGKLFAFLASFEVFIGLVSGVSCNAIYTTTVNISASIVFYILGSLSAIPLILAV